MGDPGVECLAEWLLTIHVLVRHPVDRRPLQCRDCRRHHRLTSGCGGLPDMDILLQAPGAEPKLLRPGGHVRREHQRLRL